MSPQDMQGRVSLVTGASRGIGRAVALALAERGSHLILVARQAGPLEEVAAACAAHGAKARALPLDIGEGEAVRSAVDEALREHGRVDHLVNNAGITADALLLRMKRDEWDRVVRVNLGGAFEMTRAVLPAMIKARYGRIVNVTSVVGLMGNPGQTNYCAAKAGLIGFTKSLAREVASRQITVNAIAPGFIDTDMTRALPEAAREKMITQIPLGRLGAAQDVANGVVFLLSPAAAYITGEILNISGGLYI